MIVRESEIEHDVRRTTNPSVPPQAQPVRRAIRPELELYIDIARSLITMIIEQLELVVPVEPQTLPSDACGRLCRGKRDDVTAIDNDLCSARRRDRGGVVVMRF